MSNISLVLLTSTRQHYGLIDIDKISILDTLSKSPILRNSYKLVHIKTIPGDEHIAEIKKIWFKNNGFDILETIGEWKNDDITHGRGLIEDMAKIYSHPNILKNDYVLHCENDWLWLSDNIDEYLYKSIIYLNNYCNLIYHRYSRIDQPDLPKRLNASCLDENNRFFIVNREFSFNPFISRARDMKYISNFVLKNNIHPHCEMAYELAAKYLNNDNNIFSFTHNQIIQHRGGKEDKEWYENKLKELNL